MLVDSIGYLRKNDVVSGVDTSKVQARPVIAQVSKDFNFQSFTDNPLPAPAEPTEEKSVLGKLLNVFA